LSATQLRWTSLRFPAGSDACVGDTLRKCLHFQRAKARLRLRRDELGTAMQPIQVLADYIRIKQHHAVVAYQHRDLAEWIEREDRLIAQCRTGFVMHHGELQMQARFMCGHEHFASVG
jgi:hypothetical protein